MRALWPEIQKALQSGQTLKTVRDWLEAEGITLQYNQLTTYIWRIRRAQTAKTGGMFLPEPVTIESQGDGGTASLDPSAGQSRDPLANFRARQGKHRTFEYNPDFKEEDLL